MFIKCLSTLNLKDRKRLFLMASIQSILNLLDLLGVLLIGVVAALSINYVQGSTNQSELLSKLLSLLRITNMHPGTQIAMISLIAIAILFLRSIGSIIFSRRILYFFSRRSTDISTELLLKLLRQPITVVERKSAQDRLYALTRGLEIINMDVLATSMILFADLSLLFILAAGLFVASPSLAAVLIVFFAVTGLFSFRNLSGKAKFLGSSLSELSIQSNSKVIEVLSAFRETVVKGRQTYYAGEIKKIRLHLTDVYAEIHFLPMVSKYVIEISVIVGAIIMAIFQILITDAANAVASLTLFLVAGTRMAPSALRVQQGLLQIKSGLGMAQPSIELIQELSDCTVKEFSEIEIVKSIDFTQFEAGIELEGVSFAYQDSITPAVQNVSVSIRAGTRVAIVGASGAGKSTLADLILGVLKQDQGEILIGGLTVEEVIIKWPGAIAYVPQDVVIIDGTIRENISMGYSSSESADEHILNILDLASLNDFLREKALGIDTAVGDSGTRLSGGERQRIGIARALFTLPKLLILDEATSSLDASTEATISRTIESLHGSTTVILIAHRLSTVRDADQVIYMSEGRILAIGKFDEVRKSIPDFNSQAELMGL